ncbi:MAG: preprotein translocase subunit SecG [Planctomycetota bacterium]
MTPIAPDAPDMLLTTLPAISLAQAPTGPSLLVIGLMVLFVLVAVVMTLVILIQKPKGGGLSGAFGGAGSGSEQAFFGAKAGDFLTWLTVGCFVTFLALAVGLTLTIRPEHERQAAAAEAASTAQQQQPAGAATPPPPAPDTTPPALDPAQDAAAEPEANATGQAATPDIPSDPLDSAPTPADISDGAPEPGAQPAADPDAVPPQPEPQG